jgi:hypothetical protein
MGNGRACAVVTAAALLLSACAGDKPGDTATGTTGGPAVEIAGRWLLSAPNAPACGMTFGGDRSKGEGAIAPEGGCPGQFFKSRRWALEQDALLIKDHNGETLGRLNASSNGFEGTATDGKPVALNRP